jgi:acetylornithine deacetylase/succinyl-diaminopimelate desuccinylase-like protein
MSWDDVLCASEDTALAELFDLVRIPSVSTDPLRTGDVRRAAVWVLDRLLRAGVPEGPSRRNTWAPRQVIARWAVDPGKPTVLVYGHFDVQPADPLALWSLRHSSPRSAMAWCSVVARRT